MSKKKNAGGRNITRRDFINGMLLASAGMMLPPLSYSSFARSFVESENYPPLLTGFRGCKPGSFDRAHELALEGKSSWGTKKILDLHYDLIVVGAGISGLSAAYFYRKEYGNEKKILILDPLDDFGGHAMRNEFNVKNQTRINYGGSQSMEDPSEYSRVTYNLLKDLGVDTNNFEKAYDMDFFKKHGLKQVTYFNKKIYGENKLVNYSISDFCDFVPGVPPSEKNYKDAVGLMPLTDEAKIQLLKVLETEKDGLDGIPLTKRADYVKTTSYFNYLNNRLKVDDPQVLNILRLISADDWGIGTDALSVAEAVASGAPGLSANAVVPLVGDRLLKKWMSGGDDYIHHFPDGNASIARLLVRKLVPDVASGSTMNDIVLAKFDYSKLDQKESKAAIRLNSTVINVMHEGGIKEAKKVLVSYVNDGTTYQVSGSHCIMACYNMIIPYLMPELAKEQKESLSKQVKIPLVYTTVMLKNWRAMKELGVAVASCPGNLHHIVLPDFPISMGGYRAVCSPDDPLPITMIYTPLSKKYGTPPVEQFREGRYRLLDISFDQFETEIKEHLSEMLGPGGFNAEKDIDAITVNRWAHGYSYSGTFLHDSEMERYAGIARKPFGRIAIANSDSGASAYVNTAIDQAWRAVYELT